MARSFQAPKGTRDFYPDAMAVRRHIERAWRTAATNHGFDEIEGPTYEHLELYTVKSGEGIVSELFSFRRSGGDTDYALRPEFTPTLARMAAARGASLPTPTKWFAIPVLFRAERPQRGRLREHVQWNVDLIGDDSPAADAEIIAAALAGLARLGLTSEVVKVRVSHREVVSGVLTGLGLAPDQLPAAFDLLDRRDKLPAEVFAEKTAALGFSEDARARFDAFARQTVGRSDFARVAAETGVSSDAFGALEALDDELRAVGLADWITYDFGIVRGLAYYTGTVFEIHETTGKERAVAGGGRYDQLIELLGGPSLPACGFGMGDVVLGLVLADHGLLDAGEMSPRPDVFVINARDEPPREHLRPIVAALRADGLHVRHSYRATKNVGKLLSEAKKAHARLAVILGRELDEGRIVIKDLDGGEQSECGAGDLADELRTRLAGAEATAEA